MCIPGPYSSPDFGVAAHILIGVKYHVLPVHQQNLGPQSGTFTAAISHVKGNHLKDDAISEVKAIQRLSRSPHMVHFVTTLNKHCMGIHRLYSLDCPGPLDDKSDPKSLPNTALLPLSLLYLA